MKRTRGEVIGDSRKRARHEGIEIKHIKYNKRRTDVPSLLRGQYDTIQILGDMKYLDYQDSPLKPWQSDIKRKALHLTHMAARCRADLQNEAGWRDAIESKIFERFDVEVACKKCRGRLWRSEIEVESDSSNSLTTSLRDRQKKREVCTCDPSQRADEHSSMDPGISNLFSFRVDTAALDRNSNRKHRPDRIHGLRRTENIDTHLQSLYTHNDRLAANTIVEDVVETSLHPNNGGSQLLFPFLVVEAKSEKGVASFEQMELQTCFPIQNSLQLQLELLETQGNTMGVPGGPLVWYLAYRGEDWRLYAGHVEVQDGKPKVFINYLWGGSINGVNESLQLVLIVDYIVDWARDTYRPNILRQLKSLASSAFDDRATVDPDVVSLNGEIENWMDEQCSDDSPSEEPQSPPQLLLMDAPSDESIDNILDPLEQQFKNTHGLVKDVRRINSRLRGLLITRDNLDTLFRCFKTPKQVWSFSRRILVLLRRQGVVVNGAALGAIEERWTGRPCDPSARPIDASRIHVQLQVSYYVNPVWEIFRELTYLAVEDDALELLVQRAAYKRRGPITPPDCRKDRVLAALDSLLDRSVLEDFMSALCRRTYMLGFDEPSTVIIIDDYNVPEERQEVRPVFQQAKDTNAEKPGIWMQSVVRMVFDTVQFQTENHTMPDRQLLESIRDSTHVSLEERMLSQPGDCLFKDQKAFLVHSNVPSTRHLPDLARRKYCLYILVDQEADMTEFSVISKLLSTLQRREVYSTVRRARVPCLGSVKQWHDNRGDFSHPYSSPTDGQPLMSESQFQGEVCDWIKSFARPTSDRAEDLAELLNGWYLSAGAVAALRTRRRYNVQERTWSTRLDASRIRTLWEKTESPPGRSEAVLTLIPGAPNVFVNARSVSISQQL
ncbi:uncharacterized protein N0V89_000544 [Didymosphaeria variabile]|uniref:Uncharacterized protein n=1 Tax=Didymosphaeria variabile TaxID=1932322 RepID=A0A9W8XWV1_9PLEO|nr:uncharacterized protein N0V89_000544 [Didymosphaeria variabile]KAJ4359985.1 hypothetical protein N0V89_000544 [Didymosphaeria variabile]